MITTDRNIFIGAHVTETVRKQMEEQAKKIGVSMSIYTFEALKDRLRNDGYDPDAPMIDPNAIPLPFEGTDETNNLAPQRTNR